MRRVVITGIGIYSVIGRNIAEVKESLQLGRSGIVFDQARKELGFRSALTGALERPNLKGVLPRRMRVGLPEQGEYAYVATKEAIANANLTEDYFIDHEVGILFRNDSSITSSVEAADIVGEKKDTTLIGSGSIFQSMNSTVSMNLSVIFKLKGVNMTVSAACASGSHAIGLGLMFIQNGMQDMVICGGAQEVNALSTASFDGLSAFSTHEEDPSKASRPFDKNRDGLVPSGGAATVILESYESAIKRGAPIYGEVLGYGFSSNGDHISVPNVEGPIRSLDLALKQAGVKASDIDYVNAHATSTPIGDSNEAQALYKIFGSKTPISSTKSMTGHEMWMGGASEIIYSLLMMHNDFIAPNINFKNPDEFSKLLNIIPETEKAKINLFLSNSFGFGGTNSSLVIRRV